MILGNAALLQTLCVQRDKNADRLLWCRELGQEAVAALLGFDAQTPANDWQVRTIDRAALLNSLVKLPASAPPLCVAGTQAPNRPAADKRGQRHTLSVRQRRTPRGNSAGRSRVYRATKPRAS